MIDFISGILTSKDNDSVVIEISGLGYKINVPQDLFYQTPQIGSTIKLFTHLIHKEDLMELYGFVNQEERTIFRHLLSVQGVGPKLALKILSFLKPKDIIKAIIQNDALSLSQVSGLGKKKADKIILELESKFKKNYVYVIDETDSLQKTALEALLTLGYKETESIKAIKQSIQNHKTTESIVQASLKILAHL